QALPDDDRFMDGGILIADGLHIATYSADMHEYEDVKKVLEKQSAEYNTPINEAFLNVLKFGLPPTAGFGLGINRLIMLTLGPLPRNVRETCLYPL
ncbi:MAG: hypothetical protein M3Q80_01710, partial [bacterium]|nr:hypothetical protein [bacterium]